jgi:hypothetical protein
LNFLVDTGAGISVINRPVAEELGLNLGRKVTVHGVNALIEGRLVDGVRAQLCGVSLPRAWLAVDLSKLSNACERPVDGLVGADFFRGRIVEIEFSANKVRVLTSCRPNPRDVVLPLVVGASGMRVPISVDQQNKAWVRLDTGCASSLQWVTSDRQNDGCPRQVAIGLAELSIAQTTLPVRLGGHRFENVPVGLHSAAIFPGEAGLLGNGLLSAFGTVTIDARGGRLILGQPAALPLLER